MALVKVVNATYILQLLQVYFYAQIRILTANVIETKSGDGYEILGERD